MKNGFVQTSLFRPPAGAWIEMKKSLKLPVLIFVLLFVMPIPAYCHGELLFFRVFFIFPLSLIGISLISISLKKKYIELKIGEVKNFYDIKSTTISENISYLPVFGLIKMIIENSIFRITATLVIFFAISYLMNWIFYSKFSNRLSDHEVKIGAFVLSIINVFLVSTIFILYSILSSVNTFV
jgi:hypothetical protein